MSKTSKERVKLIFFLQVKKQEQKEKVQSSIRRMINKLKDREIKRKKERKIEVEREKLKKRE